MEFKREDCADKVERVRKGREAGVIVRGGAEEVEYVSARVD